MIASSDYVDLSRPSPPIHEQKPVLAFFRIPYNKI